MAIQRSQYDHWMQHVASVVCASWMAAVLLIAGAALTFTSGQTEATPNKVTKNTPCGSCHPSNKPPKTR
jgi:cytochrome c553